jgi:Radial spokehead-like protein
VCPMQACMRCPLSCCAKAACTFCSQNSDVCATLSLTTSKSRFHSRRGLRGDCSRMCRVPHIKAAGVTVLPPLPEAEDDEEPSAVPVDMLEKGPPVLSPADTDTKVQHMHAWAPVTSASSRAVKHQVCGVRSLLWPGAVAVTNGIAWSNVYVGWGMKRADVNRALKPPPMMCAIAPPSEQDALPPPPPEPEAEEA